MALTETGLTVQTYEQVLDSIVVSEQENVSSKIEVDDDTSLGQTNKIMAQEISSVNELVQNVYNQRSIYKAEGTALDDNVSWLGLTRQQATATSGEQYFVGDDGTTLSAGSYVQNESTLENYTLNSAVSISKDSCRVADISVSTVNDSSYVYTVSVQGVFSQYTSQTNDTATEIIAGLVLDLTANAAGLYTAVDNGDDTLTIATVDTVDTAVTIDANLKVDSVTSAGNITGINTGQLPAPANTVTTILSPTGGWKSTYNFEALVIGRAEETDAELRSRAINFRSSSGKATVDSIKAALLDVSGVSSVSINERFVSQGAADTLVEITTVTDNTIYTITIDGNIHTITSASSGATAITIAGQLVSEINTSLYSTYYNAVDDGDGTFRVMAIRPRVYEIGVAVTANMNYSEGQHAGSIQVVVAGGTDDNLIAQTIWDTKPAGVEVWAANGDTYNTGIAVDEYDQQHVIAFNRPVSILITTVVTYKVFDTGVYPETDQDAYDAITAAIVTFGNELGAGEYISPNEFEGTIYGAVNGIYNVKIKMSSINGNADSTDPDTPDESIVIATDEEAFFDADNITVTKQI